MGDGPLRFNQLDAEEARPVPVNTPARVAIAAPEKTSFVHNMRLACGPLGPGRDADSHQLGAVLKKQLAAITGPERLDAAIGRDLTSWARPGKRRHVDLLARRNGRLICDPLAVRRKLAIRLAGRRWEKVMRRPIAVELHQPDANTAGFLRAVLIEHEPVAVW